jgi:gliding motility-associated-like protein
MPTHFRIKQFLLQATLLLLLLGSTSTTSIAQIDCDDPERSVITYFGSSGDEIPVVCKKVDGYGYVIGGFRKVGSTFTSYLGLVNNCGEIIWQNFYNISEFGAITGIVLEGGYIYCTTYKNSPSRTALVQVDMDGNAISTKFFGDSQHYPRKMVRSSDDNLLIAGQSNSASGAGATDSYIVKTTFDGSILWQKMLGNFANDYAHNMIEDSDGNILIMGYTKDYVAGVLKGFVVKLSSTGALLWGKEYHKGPGLTRLHNATEFGDFYYFTGICDVGTSGDDDGIVIKTDKSGNLIWSKMYGTFGFDQCMSIHPKDGNLYVSGIANSVENGFESVLFSIDVNGNLLETTSIASTRDDLFESSAGEDFGIETDGFYVAASAKPDLTENVDNMFYRFDSFENNCQPGNVVLTVLDGGILVNDYVPILNTTAWTMTSATYPKSAVGLFSGIICTNVDSLDTCEIVVNAEYVIDGVSSEDGATSGCLSNEIQFNDLSTTDDVIVDWDWDFGDGTGSSAENPTHTYTTEGTYTITLIVTTELGCTDTITLEIDMVGSSIAVDFIADVTEGCEPLTVQFDNTSESGVSCEWDFGDGSFASSCGSVTHTYLTDGVYDVSLTVTGASGCFGTLVRNSYINVFPVPVANFVFTPNSPTTLDTEVAFTNYSIDADSWLWIFDVLGTSSMENPTIIIPGIPANYDITLIAITENGCKDTIIKTINVVQDETIYVPNTFTPDGDTFNELFRPYITGIDPYDFHMIIFNRWGEIVFESYDATGGWNGAYGGKLVQDGVYVWQIVTSDLVTDKKLEYYGHVTVLR